MLGVIFGWSVRGLRDGNDIGCMIGCCGLLIGVCFPGLVVGCVTWLCCVVVLCVVMILVLDDLRVKCECRD